MLKVAILGASGYTGLELLKILSRHDEAEVVAVTSRKYTGKPVTGVFPSLRGFYDGLCFTDHAGGAVDDAVLVFCCLPHGASMEAVPRLLGDGKRVVDLSADYRLRDADLYEKWYKEHTSKELLSEAVYGLPEFYRDAIRDSRLVANPGCYPTGALLALAPLVKHGLIDTGSIIIDSKSGVSGAGRTPSVGTSFVEVSEGFKAYKVGEHRHTPEIEEVLGDLAAGDVSVTFTPHLLPVSRGILSTIYADLKEDLSAPEPLHLYSEFYRDEPFVRICPEDTLPNINQVKGSNYCDIWLKVDNRTGRVIIISVIDNLVKGASGQAVQNMNIMFGLPEETGLDLPPL